MPLTKRAALLFSHFYKNIKSLQFKKPQEPITLTAFRGFFKKVSDFIFYTMPCPIIASATFIKPAILAPFT